MGKKSEQGNVLEIVIIAVLALAVIGLLVWRFMDSNAKTDNDTNAPQAAQNVEAKDDRQQPDASQPTNPNEGYIVIDEWGVRLKPAGDAQYSYVKIGPDTYGFSTSVLESLGQYCTAKEGGRGILVRSMYAAPEDGVLPLGTLLNNGKAIDGYYYFMQGPQGPCTDKDSDVQTEIAQAKLVRDLILTMEAAQ